MTLQSLSPPAPPPTKKFIAMHCIACPSIIPYHATPHRPFHSGKLLRYQHSTVSVTELALLVDHEQIVLQYCYSCTKHAQTAALLFKTLSAVESNFSKGQKNDQDPLLNMFWASIGLFREQQFHARAAGHQPSSSSASKRLQFSGM